MHRIESDVDAQAESPELSCICPLPAARNRQVRKRQVEFNQALKQMTPEDVRGYIVPTFPKCNPFNYGGTVIPGMGKFPVDEWIRMDKPVMDEASWLHLAKNCAEKNMENLENIWTVADKRLQELRRLEEAKKGVAMGSQAQ